MKITEVKSLIFPEVKVIRFARFCDHRGYFSEHYRRDDFQNHSEMGFIKDIEFLQCNESASKKGTIRGLHFQWNPYMGKLVRTLSGHMIDMVLDIRKGSPTLGKIILYDMSVNIDRDFGEWIWIPHGFVHGNIYIEDSVIEYFCSGQYNPDCEAGISPLAEDIEWDLCDSQLKWIFDEIAPCTQLITEKDRNGFSMKQWGANEHSENFIFHK